MPSFVGPIDPAGWSLDSSEVVTVPAPFRYAGRRAFALRAERGSAAPVVAPAPVVLRRVAPADPADPGSVAVEIQVRPFRIRDAATAIPFGLPTFYILFHSGSSVTQFTDDDAADAGDLLGTANAVKILCVGQNRVARDPALWSAEILAALPQTDRAGWQPFADAVAAQTAGGANPPVLLLDHRGAPLEEAAVEIVSGATTATAVMTAADAGDLQRTVARMHAANPGTMPLASVFGAGGRATLRPQPSGTDDFQLALLEGATDPAASTGSGEIDVTPQQRHVTFTDLRTWFAEQSAGLPAGHVRYTRRNLVTPYVNGPDYYDVLFRQLHDADGLHLGGGWATFPDVELTVRRDGDPTDLPVTLEQAAKLIGSHGGKTRFLSPKFVQLDEGSPIETGELLAFYLIIVGLLRFQNVDFLRSDAGGAVILLALYVINLLAVTWIVDENGKPLEPSKDAVDILGAVPNAVSVFSPYPAEVADNPAAPPPSNAVFSTIFKTDRHFGIYHQKLAIASAGGTRYGYCGGIDINPNRLDDARHLSLEPFHDVHAQVRGPAVPEIELSFAERWTRDGGGTDLAFDPADPATIETHGFDAVQVARTYFKPAAASRQLSFAQEGDDTIRRTLLGAIANAREHILVEDQYFTPPGEYTHALAARLAETVAARRIQTLLILLTGVTDQPFGEASRSGAIEQLRAADNGAGILRVGYLRRHYTLPDNELRASSGRLTLMQDLDAAGGVVPNVVLGPKQRLPQPPFWFAVEGELMYAFDESPMQNLVGDIASVFQVLRGPDTRLVKGGPVATAIGPRTRPHPSGAAATVVDLAGIYVHSKLTIVDDVFMSIGSANVDRRGFYHDGEINVFSVPQQLKASRGNPVAALRRKIWAEVLDLPLATAEPLLEDPLAAATLFGRSPLLGNRFTDIDAYPTHLMFDATGGDGLVMLLLKLALGSFVTVDQGDLYNAVVDPTSALDPAP
jgi:phosphatidylserine/phosphatidylglycerophosphate/cardiolipin synthase-like enzyme